MKRQRVFLLSLTFLIIAIGIFMLAPFLKYLFMAIILGFILQPVHRRLQKHIGANLSAGSLVLLTVLAAMLPFAIILIAIGNDAASLVSTIQSADLGIIYNAEQLITEYTGRNINLESRIASGLKSLGSALVGNISGAVGFAANLFIGLSLMLFLQFYILKDGEGFIEWTKGFDFMPNEMQNSLYQRTSDTTWAVIKGHVLVAIVQGLVAGVGLWITGIPNFVFWTFIMIILGFIPLVGTAFVWVPAVVYLAFIGQFQSALILLAFGAVVVGAIDNFLRPFLVDESADVHPFFIIAGVIGGVGIFGVSGIFIGPVIFGVLKTLLNMVRDSYSQL